MATKSFAKASKHAENDVQMRKLDPEIEVTMASGVRVVAPGGARLAMGIVDEVGDIVDLACRIFGVGCPPSGGGNTGTGTGCYKIIMPDGATVTICPAPQVAIA